MPFELRSPSIHGRGPIPERYTGDGANLSPPLEWSDPPPDAKSFALLVEDTDAPSGSFWHWAAYNIGGAVRQLPEGAGDDRFDSAINDFGEPGYGGPKPPRGDGPHRYHFRLVALDVERLDLPPSIKVRELWRRLQEHKVGETELVATSQR